jgi:hypothetical protein
VHALRRVRWLLPALVVPAAVTALGLGVQALAFDRPAPGQLLATEALRELVQFRAMDASERLPNGRVRSLCVEGWFHARHHRRVHHGALVLLSDGTRLYDLGHGIRSWDGLPAARLNRRRFLLAGCPHAFDARLASALVHGAGVSVTAVHDNGTPAYELRVRKSPLGLVVAARTLRPIEVFVGTDHSILRTARAAAALRVVRRAFKLATPRRQHRA